MGRAYHKLVHVRQMFLILFSSVSLKSKSWNTKQVKGKTRQAKNISLRAHTDWHQNVESTLNGLCFSIVYPLGIVTWSSVYKCNASCMFCDIRITRDHVCTYLVYITKTYLYNYDPLKSHFYIVKLGFTGVYMMNFLISAQKHRFWVLVRTALPRRF